MTRYLEGYLAGFGLQVVGFYLYFPDWATAFGYGILLATVYFEGKELYWNKGEVQPSE